jgi:hypothetical protein
VIFCHRNKNGTEKPYSSTFILISAQIFQQLNIYLIAKISNEFGGERELMSSI